MLQPPKLVNSYAPYRNSLNLVIGLGSHQNSPERIPREGGERYRLERSPRPRETCSNMLSHGGVRRMSLWANLPPTVCHGSSQTCSRVLKSSYQISEYETWLELGEIFFIRDSAKDDSSSSVHISISVVYLSYYSTELYIHSYLIQSPTLFRAWTWDLIHTWPRQLVLCH